MPWWPLIRQQPAHGRMSLPPSQPEMPGACADGACPAGHRPASRWRQLRPPMAQRSRAPRLWRRAVPSAPQRQPQQRTPRLHHGHPCHVGGAGVASQSRSSAHLSRDPNPQRPRPRRSCLRRRLRPPRLLRGVPGRPRPPLHRRSLPERMPWLAATRAPCGGSAWALPCPPLRLGLLPLGLLRLGPARRRPRPGLPRRTRRPPSDGWTSPRIAFRHAACVVGRASAQPHPAPSARRGLRRSERRQLRRRRGCRRAPTERSRRRRSCSMRCPGPPGIRGVAGRVLPGDGVGGPAPWRRPLKAGSPQMIAATDRCVRRCSPGPGSAERRRAERRS